MANRMLVVPLAVIAVVLASGCAVGNTPTQATEFVKEQVLSYANPIADSMLPALNSGNYSQFSASFSQTMATALNLDKFNALTSNLHASIGKYVSRDSAAEVVEIGGYYRVTYTTQFTMDSPVGFIITFSKDSGTHSVEGVFLTSKKLSGSLA